MHLAVKGNQAVELGVDAQHDVSAPAAVSAVGSTVRHVLFTAKAYHSIAPVAGFDVNFGLIEKHAGLLLLLFVGAPVDSRLDKGRKERMGAVRPGTKLGVKLAAQHKGMVGEFRDLYQAAVG